MELNMIKCSRCKEQKEEKDFSKCKSNKNGHQSSCKKCMYEMYRKRSESFRTERRKPNIDLLNKGLKVCFSCKEEKTLDNYNKQPLKSSVDGYHPYCRQCRKVKRDLDYKNNLEQSRLKGVKKSHARRAKKKNLDSGLVTTQFLKELYREETCFYCQEHIERKERTIDHVIAIHNNGIHHPNNLVMCCYYCNRSKGSKSKEEYLKWLLRYNGQN